MNQKSAKAYLGASIYPSERVNGKVNHPSNGIWAKIHLSPFLIHWGLDQIWSFDTLRGTDYTLSPPLYCAKICSGPGFH